MAPSHLSLADSNRLDERAAHVLPGGTTRGLTAALQRAPRAVSGSGYTVTGEQGQQWIDLNNNFTALIHGHAHPRIVRAAVEAVQDGASFGMSTASEIELAEVLVDRLEWPEMVRFCNSGSEAVMAAIRAARVITGRDEIVLPRPSYHGSADTALLSIGGAAANGVPERVREDVLLVDPFDADALEDLFSRRGDDIAGYVLDLVPARAGGRPLSPEYVRRAREVTSRYGAVLIVDEVVSLRHGYSGMACSAFGVTPDLTTVGKLMGGGHPVGAVLGAESVMAHFEPRHAEPVFHGGTFSGNPVTMRAGLASLELFDRAEVSRLAALGDRLRDRLNQDILALGWEATGYGSSIRFAFVGDDQPDDWATDLWWAAERRGLLAVPGNVSLCLSTPMDVDVVDDVAARVADSFAEVSERHRSQRPATVGAKG